MSLLVHLAYYSQFQVLQKSKETSLLRYEKQIYNAESGKGPGGWLGLLHKTSLLLNSQQFAVFKAVHAWRDKIARMDDDSTACVMPNHIISSIAKIMPMDMIALLGVVHPISHNVRSRAGDLLKIIQDAKVEGKDGPSMMDVLRPKAAGTGKASTPPVLAKPESRTLLAVVDDTELVSTKSSFWGGAFGSSLWDTPAAATVSQGLTLAVPLPKLSSEIFATPASPALADRSRLKTRSAVSPPQATPTKTNEPFVIKRGSKRKSEIVSEGEDMDTIGEYDISLNDIEPEVTQSKRDKASERVEKKERKRQKKLAKAQMAEEEDEEPFDYSKAESVMHGKNNGGERSSKRKKPFDPYTKSEDAPGRLRRLQSERPGKSHTFKK